MFQIITCIFWKTHKIKQELYLTISHHYTKRPHHKKTMNSSPPKRHSKEMKESELSRAKKKSKAIAGPALYCRRRLHRLSCRPLSQWTDQTHQHQQEKPEIAETANLTFTGRSPGSGQEKKQSNLQKDCHFREFLVSLAKKRTQCRFDKLPTSGRYFWTGGTVFETSRNFSLPTDGGCTEVGLVVFPPFWSQLKSLFLQRTTTEKQEIQQTATA